MTRLSYKVGNVEVVSYRLAKELEKRTGLKLQRVFTEVEEDFKVDPAAREKRVAAIRKHSRVKEAE